MGTPKGERDIQLFIANYYIATGERLCYAAGQQLRAEYEKHGDDWMEKTDLRIEDLAT